MKRSLLKRIHLLLFILFLINTSCNDDLTDADNNTDPDQNQAKDEIKFENIVLSGANEVPGNAEKASGTLNATYYNSTNLLSYTITFEGVVPESMHFHNGGINATGNVEIPINPPYFSGMKGTTIALTTSQELDLLAGNWYLNVHTPEYFLGILRGQLEEGEVIIFNDVVLSGANEVPANTSAASGMFIGSYNKKTNVLYYTIVFDGISPTAMHIHNAETGASGEAVIDIDAETYISKMTRTNKLTEEQEAELLSGNWYINIHSSNFPEGEIRGQIE